MNEYLLGIIGTVLFSSLIVAILPEGKTAGAIKGIAKMVCLLTIIAPIPQYLQKQGTGGENEKIQEFFSTTGIQTDESFIQYYSEMRIADTEQTLQEEIKQVFSCNAGIELQIDTQTPQSYTTSVKISAIIVCLPAEEGADIKEEIRTYLTERYGCGVVFEE